MSWLELKPANSDLLSELPSTLTGQAVTIRQALEKHSFWTDSSGASAGIPRLSAGSPGPGSARAFFDVLSNLSTSLLSTKPLMGRLYITSDTHRLYAYTGSSGSVVPSDLTVQVGARDAVVYYGPSLSTITQGTRVFAIASNASVPINSRTTVSFTTAFLNTPTVQVTPGSTVTTDFFHAWVVSSSTTNVVLSSARVVGSLNTCTVWWRAHGYVAL